MKQPELSLSAATQASVELGTVDGYRQGLQQCAEQLRKQARDWRAQAKQRVDAAGLQPVAVVRAKLVAAEVERWATRLETLADQIMAQHDSRTAELEQRRKMATTLLTAVEQRKGWRPPWRR